MDARDLVTNIMELSDPNYSNSLKENLSTSVRRMNNFLQSRVHPKLETFAVLILIPNYARPMGP